MICFSERRSGVGRTWAGHLCFTLYTAECWEDLCGESRAHQDQGGFQSALMGQSFSPYPGHNGQGQDWKLKRSLSWCSGAGCRRTRSTHIQEPCLTQPGMTQGPWKQLSLECSVQHGWASFKLCDLSKIFNFSGLCHREVEI